MSGPERIWMFSDALKPYLPGGGKIMMGDTEYIRADLVQALVDDAMKRALYATRDRTWSGVEALISDQDALRAIMEDQE